MLLLLVAAILSGGACAVTPMVVMGGLANWDSDDPTLPPPGPTMLEIGWITMWLLAALCWVAGGVLTAMRSWRTERAFAVPLPAQDSTDEQHL